MPGTFQLDVVETLTPSVTVSLRADMAVTGHEGDGALSAIHHAWVWPILSIGVIFLAMSVGAISVMCYDAFKICRKTKFTMLRSIIERAKTRKVTEDQPGTNTGKVSEKKPEIPIFTVAEIVSNDDRSNDYNILQEDCQLSVPTITRRPSRLSLLASDIWSASVHQIDTKSREGWQHLVNVDLTDSEKADHSSNTDAGFVSAESDLPCFDPSTLLDDSSSNKVITSRDTLEINRSTADIGQATTIIPSIELNSTSPLTCIARTLSDRVETFTHDRKKNTNTTKKTQWPILEIPTHSPMLKSIFSRAGLPSKSFNLQQQFEMVSIKRDSGTPTRSFLRSPSSGSLKLKTGAGDINHNSNWTKRPLGVMGVEDSFNSLRNPKICQ
ncbi:uncharacterized protein [Palaemon carinicauda]|uniref:uncharacterized protein n=1 Tax=Palaemon carinicauda TaxID=392227 RepID=UPI0035B5C5FC